MKHVPILIIYFVIKKQTPIIIWCRWFRILIIIFLYQNPIFFLIIWIQVIIYFVINKQTLIIIWCRWFRILIIIFFQILILFKIQLYLFIMKITTLIIINLKMIIYLIINFFFMTINLNMTNKIYKKKMNIPTKMMSTMKIIVKTKIMVWQRKKYKLSL